MFCSLAFRPVCRRHGLRRLRLQGLVRLRPSQLPPGQSSSRREEEGGGSQKIRRSGKIKKKKEENNKNKNTNKQSIQIKLIKS